MTDRYQIISPITSNGGGSFFRGWDKHQNRDVSIQRLKVDGEISLEVLREARVLYGLRHPNIVTVFEFGSDSEGVYLVREMVKGKSLENLVAQRPLSEKEFKILVRQTLSALDAAHTSGLIHRNLQPATLLVPWNAENNFSIKITDFSLGAPTDPAVPRSLEAEHFMAPEQFGNAPVTLRADLYSLGAIFYTCLTQQHAFQGTHSADVVIAHLYHRFVPLAELRPDLSATLCAWVERLMKQNAAERPASAEEALQTFKLIPDEEIAVATPIIEEVFAPIMEEEEEVEEAENEDEPMAVAMADEAVVDEVKAAPAPEPAADLEPIAFASPAPTPEPARPDATPMVRPEVKNPRRGGMPAMTLILMAFGAILVGMLALVSYLKYTSQDDRQQRLTELSQSEHPQGSDIDVHMLLDLLEEPDHRDAAASVLAKLQGGDYIDTMVIDHMDKTRAYAGAIRLVEVIGQRGLRAAFAKVLPFTVGQSEVMTKAAWTTLARITDHGDLPRLIAVIGQSKPRDADLIEESLTTAIEGASDRAQATEAARQGYHTAVKDATSRAILLNVLTRVGGGSETLAVITAAISDSDEDVRRAAIILLARYPTHDPLAVITTRFPEETDPACRAYLLLAAKELITKPGASSQEALARHVQSLYANAKNDDEKDEALAAIGKVIAPSTATFYQDYAAKDDPALRREALALSGAYQRRLTQIVAIAPGATSTPLPAAQADSTLGGSITLEKDVLVNWTRDSDWASWLVQFPANGDYEVVVHQAHAGKATGTYEVLLAGQTKLTAVVKTASDSDFKGFVVGRFTIAEPGIYKLLVRPKQISANEELFRVQKMSVRPL
ncbi:MAG: protein kinase [Prosthecobacter sp.]|nr:protein kinase [Prosthecobacter sp.]